jgi:hypothetical protein
MGDPFKKVHPGQRLVIPAVAYNAFVDAAADRMADQFRSAGGPVACRPDAIVLVKNGAGEDLDRFGVLAISGLVFNADDNLDEFQNHAALAGQKPTAADRGLFVILQEPLIAGKIGRAKIAGVTPVLVDVVDEGDAYADVEPDPDYALTRLKSALSGAARILWKQSGTGEKWAYVHFPVASPAVLGGKVLTGGVRNTSNAAWQSFILAGEAFVSHLVVHACDPDGSNVRTGRDCYVKAQADPDTAPSGYERISEDDVILWTPTGQGLDPVPGTDPVLCFDGYLLAVAGASGAQLTFRVVD